MQKYYSKILESAIKDFNQLPGIGEKTAMRLVLHLLKQNKINIKNFGNNIIKLAENIKYCEICNNISDNEICEICIDEKRNKQQICVVETIKDLIAIENTLQYKGLYFVIGGKISPSQGISPSDINIEKLIKKIQQNEIDEVILAISTTMEGETTKLYIYKKLSAYNIKITTLAKGIAIGDELEYIDEITLANSIANRVIFV